MSECSSCLISIQRSDYNYFYCSVWTTTLWFLTVCLDFITIVSYIKWLHYLNPNLNNRELCCHITRKGTRPHYSSNFIRYFENTQQPSIKHSKGKKQKAGRCVCVVFGNSKPSKRKRSLVNITRCGLILLKVQ